MSDLFLGLISGTSADGIDAAIVRFDDADGGRCRARLRFGRTYPWDDALRTRLVDLGQQAAALTLDDLGELETRIADGFADAANRAMAEAGLVASDIAAIGSHGQTLRHRPMGRRGDGRDGFTLQLGDPSRIAERTGITTVADFRRRDVAAGGHGAPLLPGLHAALLQADGEDRAVLNLGGIANLTLLPAGGGMVRGFDTGPANGLMDAWCLRHTGTAFDRDGALAASGRVHAKLLGRLRAESWFDLPPPKSSGRDQFHLQWVDAALQGDDDASPADVQATLLALSVSTIADALRATQPATTRLIACGGGVHNGALMRALASALSDTHVESSAAHGLDPDYVEAMGFAWLARRTLHGLPGNLAEVTGAAGPRVLGGIYPA